MVQKITFQDKEKSIDRPDLDPEEKITHEDVNQIKRVVNNNSDNVSYAVQVSTPKQIVPFNVGVNVAGLEFGAPNVPGIFGIDYQRVPAENIEYYYGKGIRTFRIPFKWERLQKELYGPLDPDDIALLRETCDPILVKDDAVLVLDMHNYSSRYFNNVPVNIESNPFISAVTNNRIATSLSNSSGNDHFGFITSETLGINSKELKIVLPGWFGNSTDFDQNTTNDYTIEEIAVEYNGVVKFVYFDQAKSKTITAGIDKVESDIILPEQFGVSEFSKDTVIKIKGKGSVPSNGDSIPTMEKLNIDGSVIEDFQFFFYSNTAEISRVDQTGEFTPISGSIIEVSSGLCPWIVGKSSDDVYPSVMVIGDNNLNGDQDTYKGIQARGFVGEALASNTIPGFFCTANGLTISSVNSTTRIFNVISPYCNIAIEGLGSNDNLTSLSTLQTNLGSLWNAISNSGIETIIRPLLGVKTSSTDDYTTLENQTPDTNWETNGIVDQLNDWISTKVNDSTLQSVLDLRSLLSDITSPDSWAVEDDFVSFSYILNSSGHTYIGQQLSAILNDFITYDFLEAPDNIKNPVPISALIDGWIKIHQEFGNNPNIQYCLMNEPTSSDPIIWAKHCQELVLALRDAGCSNRIQIAGINYTNAVSWFSSGNADAFENFYDPIDNISIDIHNYNDVGSDGAGDSTPETALEGVRKLKRVTEWARWHKFKLVLGETAVSSVQKSREAYLAQSDYMRENDDVWDFATAWGGGPRFNSDYIYRLEPHENHPDYPNDPVSMDIVAASNNKPMIDPEVKYYTHFGKNIHLGYSNIESTFVLTRASHATSFNKDYSLTYFKNDELRITDKGLLLEKASTNLIQGMHIADNLNGITLEEVSLERAVKDPLGNYNAFNIVDNSVDDQHWIKARFTATEGLKYSSSVMVKESNFPTFRHLLGSAFKSDNVKFDVRSAGDGAAEWVRSTVTITKDSNTDNRYAGYCFQEDITNISGHEPNAYSGKGDKIILFNPMVEESPYPTAPIVTGSGQPGASRAADQLILSSDLGADLLNNNFSLILTVSDIPNADEAFSFFSIDGVSLLKRFSDYSFGFDKVADLDTTNIDTRTAVPFLGDDEYNLNRRIGISIDRTNSIMIIAAQDVDPVQISGVTIPTGTVATLDNSSAFIIDQAVYDTALDINSLDNKVKYHE